MDEVETAAPEGGETPVVSREDELGAIFDKANAEEAESGPLRDEHGRFAAKERTEETAAPTAPAEIADQGATQTQEPITHGLEAPAAWSEEAKAKWPSLSPEVQKELLRREQDWQKADGERAAKLKGYEPIEAAIEPVRQHLALQGVEPAQYVRQLVAADVFLRTKPTDAIRWIAQTYGIDLSQTTQAPEQSDMDPTLTPLLQKINTLESTLASFQTAQQQAEANRARAELEAFAKDRPHFEEVRAQMGVLIQSGAAPDLASAYDMAVWANAGTRAKLMAEQSAEAERKRQEEAAKKATDARRIATTNLSSRGTAAGTTPPQYKSREDELSAVYDRITGAA